MENRIHIYFMPGLAASSKIFEYIKLPNKSFECHYLEWSIPSSIDESLESYAKKYAAQILHEEVVLIGVSFGGVLVQEISKLIPVKRIIIISSIKTIDEIPKRLKLLKYSRAYNLFPTRRISRIDTFSKYDLFKPFKKKAELYDKYFSIRNEIYLNWALYNLLHWENKEIMTNVIHIHGNKDEILPIKHIDDCMTIDGGTHAMIITKAKQISKIIETLLLP